MVKATGIVRRIDDLGRVVIPKEIRRTLKIREGDPWRFSSIGTVKSYSRNILPLGNWAILPRNMLTPYEALGHVSCIADRDVTIAVAGAPKRSFSTRLSDLQWKRQWKSAGP